MTGLVVVVSSFFGVGGLVHLCLAWKCVRDGGSFLRALAALSALIGLTAVSLAGWGFYLLTVGGGFE